MTKLWALLLLFVIMADSVCALKIATYNVQSGVGTTKGRWQYFTSSWKYFLPHSSDAINKTADFINSENIDIITFTEIEGGSFRTKGLNQVNLVSDLTDFKESIFFPAYKIAGIVNQGNALTAKYQILKTDNHRLPGRGEPRYLGEAVLEINGQNVTFFVTHLSLQKKEREAQIMSIERIIKETEGPVVLAGDFNTNDEIEFNPLSSTRLKKVTTPPTYPSWNPKKCMDAIFLSPEFKVIRIYAPEVRFSDHLPLVVEVKLES